MAKCSKDYEPAIETFQKSLTEYRNPDTLKKLNEAEKAKKELEQQEYFDPKLADEEREKGTISLSAISCIFATFKETFLTKYLDAYMFLIPLLKILSSFINIRNIKIQEMNCSSCRSILRR